MLVLGRRTDEAILIDGGILIRVVKVIGDKVRLGIEAPDGVRILRAELIARERDGGSRTEDER